MHRGYSFALFAFVFLLPFEGLRAQESIDGVVDDVTTASDAPAIGYFDALILGLVEGITEYLPVSSTGHLILTNQLLGLDNEAPIMTDDGTPYLNSDGEIYTLKQAADAYAIIIQAGAILAVAVLYWGRLWSVAIGFLGKDPRGLKLGINLLVAFMPAVFFGLLFDDWIESKLFSPLPIAIALAGGGVLMWGVEQWRKMKAPRPADTEELDLPDLTLKQCLAIGLLQFVAMWPGTSRSMMTIVGGYLVGLSPRRAAEFSFLLGFITLSAAAGYKTLKEGENMIQVLDLGPLIFGTAIAFVSAALAIKWLVSFLSNHGLSPFAGYRILLAILVFSFMA
tara:strand:- start:3708 stop:4718 length:1011 start_codon:yes stop_codon:yes gene_type:complete